MLVCHPSSAIFHPASTYFQSVFQRLFAYSFPVISLVLASNSLFIPLLITDSVSDQSTLIIVFILEERHRKSKELDIQSITDFFNFMKKHPVKAKKEEKKSFYGYMRAVIQNFTVFNGLGFAFFPIVAGLLYIFFSCGSSTVKDLNATRLIAACDAGEVASCGDLGRRYYLGNGVPKDMAKGERLLKKACDQNIMKSCSDLAEVINKDDGTTEDMIRPVRYYKKACAGGYAEACTSLGQMYRYQRAIKPDFKKTFHYSMKGCEMGSSMGCLMISNSYATGEGVPKSQEKRVEYRKKACDLGLEPYLCKP